MGNVNSIMHDKSMETVAVAADMISGGVGMGPVSSVSPGVTDLLQTLSSLNLPPVLSSAGVTSALEKAPTADIVQMSMAAMQLENVDAMFGISDSSNAGTNSTLANLGDLLTGSAGAAANSQLPSAATSSASSADQFANYQSALQLSEAQGLFGTGATGDLSGSLLDLIG
jgi:hypothetical protein